MDYRRKQYDTLMSRLREPRGKMWVLLGQRQVGKTTLMDQILASVNS